VQLSKRFAFLLASGLALITVFACWSVSSPLGSAPDDAFHAAQIWCSKGTSSDHCEIISVNGDRLTVEVPRISPDCFWNPRLSNASCVNESVNRLPQQVSFGESDYPGGIYKVLSFFVSDNPVNSLLQMRVFNGVLATMIAVGLLILADSKKRLAFAAMWTSVLNPHGFFFISSINPTGWSFLSVSTSWLFLLMLLENHWGNKVEKLRGVAISLFFLATLLIGFSSRWDTWVFLFATYVVSVIIANTQRQWFRLSHLAIVGSSVFGLALLIAQFNPKMGYFLALNPLRNQMEKGFGQYLLYIAIHLVEFPVGVFGSDWGWGGLGGLYPSTPPVVGIVGLTVAAAIVISATRRVNTIQMISSIFLVLLILGATFQQQNVGRFFVGDMVAPRYLMGLVAVLIAVLILTSTSIDQFYDVRHFRIGAISALSITHAIALYANMDRFISFGLGSTGYFNGLNQTGGWWWDTSISPYFVWALGSLSFLLFMVTIWQFCRYDIDESKSVQPITNFSTQD